MLRARRYRRFERRSFEGTVELWQARTPTRVRASNISRGGMLLHTAERIEAGSFLTVGVRLPGIPKFTALCKVVRQDQSGAVGLSFVDVTARHKAHIESFVGGHLGVEASL